MPRQEIAPATIDGNFASASTPDDLHKRTELAAFEAQQQQGELTPYTLDDRLQVCLSSMRTIAGSYLMLGAALCDIKANEPEGSFLTILGDLGLGARNAQRYMQLWRKFSGEKRKVFAQNKSVAFLLELTHLDDDTLDGSIESGELDALERMPRKELKARLSKLKSEADTHDEIVAAKDQKINELDRKLRYWGKTSAHERASEILLDASKAIVEMSGAMHRFKSSVLSARAVFDEAGESIPADIEECIAGFATPLASRIHDVAGLLGE